MPDNGKRNCLHDSHDSRSFLCEGPLHQHLLEKAADMGKANSRQSQVSTVKFSKHQKWAGVERARGEGEGGGLIMNLTLWLTRCKDGCVGVKQVTAV